MSQEFTRKVSKAITTGGLSLVRVEAKDPSVEQSIEQREYATDDDIARRVFSEVYEVVCMDESFPMEVVDAAVRRALELRRITEEPQKQGGNHE